MHIFHLASDLGPTSTGRRLSYLVPKLKARGITQTVGNLGSDFPFGDTIRAAGVIPVQFKIRNSLDLGGLMRLRRYVKNLKPDVIHLWGKNAEYYSFAIRKRLFEDPLIAPTKTTLDDDNHKSSTRVSRQDRFCFATCHPWYEPPTNPLSQSEARQRLGLAETARVILTADRFDTPDAVKNAIWAFDMIKYTSPDWVLLVIGDGPARAPVERYSRKLAHDDHRVRFLGIRNDVETVLVACDFVWHTAQQGGRHFQIESFTKPSITLNSRSRFEEVHLYENGFKNIANDSFEVSRLTEQFFNDVPFKRELTQLKAEHGPNLWSHAEIDVDGIIGEYAKACGKTA